MPRVLIVGDENEQIRRLCSELKESGFDCLVVPHNAKVIGQFAGRSPDIVLLNMDKESADSNTQAGRIKEDNRIPVIALVSKEALHSLDSNTDIDDFVVRPWETTEVVARIKRILGQKPDKASEQVMRCGDLVIDVAKCEVSVCGKPITLTFKEYQLLKFLASNKGKVFTRDVLLDKVWGWDYYGGDRTVDVHIRRLRSKLEDMDHRFIETIRNIGYRLREL